MTEQIVPSAEQDSKELSDQDFLRLNLVRLTEPSLEGLLDQHEITESKLPSLLAKTAGFMHSHVARNSSVISSDLHPQVNIVYQCWHATRDLKSTHPLYGFARSLDSYESFIETYIPKVSSRIQGNLISRMDRFVHAIIHPSRLITVFPRNHRVANLFGRYSTSETWLRLPNKWGWDAWAKDREYVAASVLEEVNQLTQRPEADIFHASGSVALSGIERQRAILSARRALENGESVITGEHVFFYSGSYDGSVTRRKIGIGSVYMDLAPALGYSIARWFDEYWVVFGSKKEWIKRYNDEGGQEVSFFRWSDGIRVGDELPLNLIESVYVRHRFLPQILPWVRKNCPKAQLVSLEAAEIVKRISKDPDLPMKLQHPVTI